MGLAACDTVEVLFCATLLRDRLGPAVDLTRNAGIAALGVAAILASAVSATLTGVVMAVLSNSSFVEAWWGWAPAHALGLLIFAPLLLAARPEELRSLLRQRGAAARAGVLLLLTAGVTAAIFAQASYLAVCAVFPLLVVVAFSLGSAAAAVASLVVAAVSIGFSLAGLGPLASTAAGVEQSLLLQGFLLAATLVTLLVAMALADRQRLARSVAEARQLLDEGLTGMADGLALFDADDRLVLCNARCRELLPKLAHAFVPGVRYEDLIRAGVARGQYSAVADPEALVTERVATRRTGAGAGFEVELDDGRWFHVDGRRPIGGGTVAL
jgi:PAS domain-containing protein